MTYLLNVLNGHILEEDIYPVFIWMMLVLLIGYRVAIS
jgi:hypothetical protein